MDEIYFVTVGEEGVTIERAKCCGECGEFYTPENSIVFHEWQAVGDEVV